MRKFAKVSTALTAAALLIGLGATAAAQTWQETVPPRVAANARMASQDTRIDDKAEDRVRLHHDDSQIGQQERETASRADSRPNNMENRNTEDRTLNRPENATTSQIRRE
jgi:hypothetical protein